MMREVRHESLLDYLRVHGPASVQQLADQLHSSPATIRRDLDQLSEANLLERTWGGARLTSTEDDPFGEAMLNQAEAKRAIARLAAERIADGATVILDIGTTTHQVALLLRHRPLTVITASLPVFDALKDCAETHLILLGGDYSPRYQCLKGTMTAEGVARFSADVALLGCSGLNERGQVRDNSTAQVAVKQAIAASSMQRILLADHTKMPGQGSSVACTLDDVDLLITDTAVPSALATTCRRSTTEVVHP